MFSWERAKFGAWDLGARLGARVSLASAMAQQHIHGLAFLLVASLHVACGETQTAADPGTVGGAGMPGGHGGGEAVQGHGGVAGAAGETAADGLAGSAGQAGSGGSFGGAGNAGAGGGSGSGGVAGAGGGSGSGGVAGGGGASGTGMPGGHGGGMGGIPDGPLVETLCSSFDGSELDGGCRFPSISADGRFVVFESVATNLVAGDTNEQNDIFVYDRDTAVTQRVNVSLTGEESNGYSRGSSISGDGRYVVFASNGTNLVPEDTEDVGDVFFHDLETGQTTRVSETAEGVGADGFSEVGAISTDGRFIAFVSEGQNLSDDDWNYEPDVFLYERETRAIRRVSVTTSGGIAYGDSREPTLSGDGSVIGYWSRADNLVPGDTNVRADAFVSGRDTPGTMRVNVTTQGAQAQNSGSGALVSANGKFAAFRSFDALDTKLPYAGAFVHNLETRETELINVPEVGTPTSMRAGIIGISSEGRYVAFSSTSPNLVPGADNGRYQVFIRDRTLARTTLLSVAEGGAPVELQIGGGAMTDDARYVIYEARDTNVQSSKELLYIANVRAIIVQAEDP